MLNKHTDDDSASRRRPELSYRDEVRETMGRHSLLYMPLFAIVSMTVFVPRKDNKDDKKGGD